ncbi:leukocyte elastase inhibitor-like [Acanthopagrus latus]|uniref:leukocyte elastase inhibitor-like n=1 Tax=Acanthopagrus latus TaxID=8177 RepID=UPI00187CDC1F|nr:leukocyte elastase inhibitor-like [Acanthopagrus latus]
MAASTPLSEANAAFALALFKKLSEDDKTGNVFYSPFSISSALAMVMLGARGNTAAQMSEVLRFTKKEQPTAPGLQQVQMVMQQFTQKPQIPQCLKLSNSQDDVHAKFAELLSDLNKANTPYTLSVANRLYGEQSYQFVKDFLAETKKHYSAELESVDFKTNAEAARVNINSWVEKQTQDKIKDLLAEGILNEATKLVLVNAIYFKGNWAKQFKEEDTADAQFRTNKNDTKPVKMMTQTSKFRFINDVPEVNCKILEMPYKGNDLSMLILLPNEIEDDTTGLEKLEKALTYEKFVEWTEKLGEDEVEVSLPRFKMEEKYDLNDVLISMGMKDAFNVGMSDFSGMSPANDLFLSKVVHKAFVEVNEEGTEAAAATGAIISLTSIRFTPTFKADHPFLFFIRHNVTKSILFAGRFCSPE